MAKYIDVPNLMLFLKCGEYESSEDIIKFVENNATTDVIERAEYTKSLKEILRLGGLLHEANQNAMKYQGVCKKLHSNINDAIKEIEEYRDSDKNDFCEVEVGAINGVLEILKRNVRRQL